MAASLAHAQEDTDADPRGREGRVPEFGDRPASVTVPSAMAHGTPAEVAAKWSQRGQAAAPDYTAGVQRVTQSPTEAAANAADTWQQRVNDPMTKAKFQRKLRAVTLDQWKNAAVQYGASRYSQGVQSKEAKFQAAMQNLLPYIDAGVQQVKSMPNASFEDRLQRSAAFQRYMHQYQGTA